jgi:hypothetical protein
MSDSKEVRTGEIIADKDYRKAGKGIIHEEPGESEVVAAIEGKGPFAEIGVANSITINMGNFESSQVRVSCTLPCIPADIDTAYEKALDFVGERLNLEASKIREYRDRVKKDLKHDGR